MRNLSDQFKTLRSYARAIGWPAAIRLRYCDLTTRSGVTKPYSLKLRLKNSEFPVVMRARTSDREVLGQVFIEREYAPIEILRPKMILDLGANVGYASAFFLSRYPTASVLAVEPDPGNYAVCRQNLAPFGRRATVLLGAAWPERTKLVVEKGSHRDGRDWATQVKLASIDSTIAAQTDGYDVATLIDLCNAPEIDFLKIDIEKSELELFSRNTEAWLPRVKNLCIELHDADCEQVFFQALSSYSYDLSRSGELTVCRNIRALR